MLFLLSQSGEIVSNWAVTQPIGIPLIVPVQYIALVVFNIFVLNDELDDAEARNERYSMT